jgi:site-specific DNA recombinase
VEEQLQRQIKRVQTSLSRLIDAYQVRLLQKEEFEPRVRTARERLARLQSEATIIAEEREQNQCLRLALQGLEEFAGRVQSGLSEAGWHERRDIIRTLIKRVEIEKEEIRIVYRVSPPPFVRAPIGGTFQQCGQGLKPPVPDMPRGTAMATVTPRLRGEQPLHPAH